MLPTVLCLAASHPQAEQIVERLQAANIPVPDISVMLLPRENEEVRPIKGLSSAGGDEIGKQTAAGATTGGLIGAAVAIGSLAIPGLQPLLLTAPLAAAAGATAGAAAGAGSAINDLADYGIPDSRMEYYRQKLQAGSYVVAVRTEDEAELERAQGVFENAGAQEVAVFRFTKKLS